MIFVPSNKSLGVLILLVYYNRPILVRNAIRSVLESHAQYPHWNLAVLDDGSEIPAEPIVKEMLKDHLDKVRFYNSGTTFEEKIKVGITVGKLANQAIADTDQPICVTLCDDDELHPDYLRKLDRFFRSRRDVRYCYSNIYLYNPLIQSSKEVTTLTGPYNRWKRRIRCYGKVDGSQVAFRSSCMKEDDIWYCESTAAPYHPDNPFLINLDGELFKQFYKVYGPAEYTGFPAQYKGIHEHQMVFVKENLMKNEEEMRNFHKNVTKLAGEIF